MGNPPGSNTLSNEYIGAFIVMMFTWLDDREKRNVEEQSAVQKVSVTEKGTQVESF